MKFTTQSLEGGSLATIVGSITGEHADEFSAAAKSQLTKGQPVVLDMAGVDALDNQGVRALLGVTRWASMNGGKIQLSGLKANVQEVLKNNGLDRVFDMHPDAATAAASVGIRLPGGSSASGSVPVLPEETMVNQEPLAEPARAFQRVEAAPDPTPDPPAAPRRAREEPAAEVDAWSKPSSLAGPSSAAGADWGAPAEPASARGKKKKSSPVPLLLGVVFLLAAIGFAVYWFAFRKTGPVVEAKAKPEFKITDPLQFKVGEEKSERFRVYDYESVELKSGKLPAGLMLDAKDFIISGTPTAAETGEIILLAKNGKETTEKTVKFVVEAAVVSPDPPTTQLVITTASLPTGTMGQAYEASIEAAGATSFKATGLPGGLSLDAASGKITGQAAAAFAGDIKVTATGASGEAEKTLALEIKTAVGPDPIQVIQQGDPIAVMLQKDIFDRIDIAPVDQPTKDYVKEQLPKLKEYTKVIKLNFDSGKSEPTSAEYERAKIAFENPQVKAMMANSKCVFFTLGFADVGGEPKANFEISKRRATTVKAFLEQQLGVTQTVNPLPMGPTNLLSKTPAGLNTVQRNENRAVEIWAVISP